jgi:cell division protease FtsH|nr:MAG TPA_asm: ATP-dependent metalloprotease [Caudoviricetes sp.]
MKRNKVIIRKNGEEQKSYFMDIIFTYGSALFYPSVRGYYLVCSPCTLKDTLKDDVDIDSLSIKDVESIETKFEARELLFQIAEPNEKALSVAEDIADSYVDILIFQVEQSIKDEERKIEKERKEIEGSMKKIEDLFDEIRNPKETDDDDEKEEIDMGLFTFDTSKFNSKIKKQTENFDGGEKSNTTLKDVAGLEEVKIELMELIAGFNDKEKFKKFKVTPPRGVLLEGEPGNGKSLLARAIAGETDAVFYSMAGSEFNEKYVGVGASRVRDLFKKARNNRPAVIFIDEIDAVGGKREEENNKEHNATLNQLLVELASPDNEDILVIGATNRSDILDPALKRQGRLSRHIYIPNPDKKTRLEILKLYATGRPLAEDVDLEIIASQTHGMASADMEAILTEGAMIAIREDADEITQNMLLRAIDRQIAGLERKSTVMIDREKKITAYHEVGHLMMSEILNNKKLSKCTIIPHADALGYCLYHEEDDRFIRTKEDLINSMIVSLGGAVSEKVFFGHESSGCSGDLGSVSAIAQRMVCDYGMSELGKMKIDERNLFMQEKIHEEMKKIVDEAYRKAMQIVEENKELISTIAEELMEKETLEGYEVEELITTYNMSIKK